MATLKVWNDVTESHSGSMADEILKGDALADGWVKCSHGAFEPYAGLGCAACLRVYWEEQLRKSGLALSQLNRGADTAGSTPCPVCHSVAHYERGAGKVECADCGNVFEWKASRSESSIADELLKKGKL
jgi:LSD1 subclass zinc finger protein